MNALVGKLRRMAEDKALPIGEAWNALDEAADFIEEAQECLEAFCERDAVYMDSEVKGTLQCSCSCCIRARDVIEKANAELSGGTSSAQVTGSVDLSTTCKCGRALEGYETTCCKFCMNLPPNTVLRGDGPGKDA